MKQEVRRGRKFVEYHDPDTQDANTFTQEISGADVSYQDESGNWLATDENWAVDGLDGYVAKADKMNHKIRIKGTGGRAQLGRFATSFFSMTPQPATRLSASSTTARKSRSHRATRSNSTSAQNYSAWRDRGEYETALALGLGGKGYEVSV